VGANRRRLDGIAGVVQPPDRDEEEMASWPETVQARSMQMEGARGRLLELVPHLLHRLGDKKRTERARERGKQLAQDGHFPQAPMPLTTGCCAWS
jgi:hypothetical protein